MRIPGARLRHHPLSASHADGRAFCRDGQSYYRRKPAADPEASEWDEADDRGDKIPWHDLLQEEAMVTEQTIPRGGWHFGVGPLIPSSSIR